MSRAARDHQLNEKTATVRIRNSYVKDSERARRGKERTNPTNLVRRSLARRRDVLHYRRRVVDVCARGGARRRAIIFAEKNALICTERERESWRETEPPPRRRERRRWPDRQTGRPEIGRSGSISIIAEARCRRRAAAVSRPAISGVRRSSPQHEEFLVSAA